MHNNIQAINNTLSDNDHIFFLKPQSKQQKEIVLIMLLLCDRLENTT